MIEILTKNFVHIEGENLAINIAYFILGQYYNRFGNCHRPISETVGYPEREMRLEVVDLLQRDAVSGECYSHS